MLYVLLLIILSLALVVGLYFFFYYTSNAAARAILDIEPRDKWVLVTGAASGIGKQLCEILLSNKAKVIACDINESALRSSFENYPLAKLHRIKMDVSSPKEVNDAFEQVKEILNGERLFALVNNAGIGIPYALAGVIEKGEEEMQKLFSVNVFGVMRCARVFYPLMIDEENCGKNAGVILNVSSVAGKIGIPYWGYYSPTKFAVFAYSDCLRREFAEKKGTPEFVRVQCVEPGLTNTPILTVSEPLATSKFYDKVKQMKPKFELCKQYASLQEPEYVARTMFSVLFDSHAPAHLQVEQKLIFKAIWWISNKLPLGFTDWFVPTTLC